MSERTPIYRLFNESGDLLYIGLTARVSSRMREHSQSQPWWESVTRIELEWFPTAREAWRAERTAILAENPRHNVIRHPVTTRRLPPNLWAKVPPELARAIKRAVGKIDQADTRRGRERAVSDLARLVYKGLCLGCRPSEIGLPVQMNREKIIRLRDRHIEDNPGLPVPDREFVRRLRRLPPAG